MRQGSLPAPGMAHWKHKSGAEFYTQHRLIHHVSHKVISLPAWNLFSKIDIIPPWCNISCYAKCLEHSYRVTGCSQRPAVCPQSCFRPHSSRSFSEFQSRASRIWRKNFYFACALSKQQTGCFNGAHANFLPASRDTKPIGRAMSLLSVTLWTLPPCKERPSYL